MSSWVQASWIVQRILDSFEIPEKINNYNKKLTNLQDEIARLDLGKIEIETAQNIQTKIDEINTQVQNIVETKKFAFLAPQDQEENFKNSIKKDTIWFVVEQTGQE